MPSLAVLEGLAVILALAYLLLATKQHIACWYAAFFSTALYTFIYWDVRLYMESMLNIYYLLMAIYGYLRWTGKAVTGKGTNNQSTIPIRRWTTTQHSIALTLIITATVINGYLLQQNSDAALPYLDSFSTWGAVIATYMVTQKILENWLYWLIINSVGIYLNIDRGLEPTALLLCSYQVIAIFGWWQWNKTYRAKLA